MNDFINKFPVWLKKNIFNTPTNSIISVFVLALSWKAFEKTFEWLIINSVWNGDATTCREAGGFCFPFIFEKMNFILFGFYPQDISWRPLSAVIILLVTLYYSKEPKRWRKSLLYIWFISTFLFFWLMRGGIGLEYVPSDKWGGLPLTLMLSIIGIVCSYPIGILLALARRSKLKILKSMSVTYIELIRGVPLISLLFMSSVMFPLFLPEGVNFDKLLRAQVAIILFVAAYMAENIRGGLSSIDQGQYEAAQSLGLSYKDTMRFIIIPQAIRVVIPPTVNTAIGMFKDTSLVLIIALFDLLNTTKTALRDAEWLGFTLEAYFFVGLIYFIFCFGMSKYSQRLEVEFGIKER